MKAVHVLQPVRGIDQLNKSVARGFAGDELMPYKLDTVNPFVPLHELVYVAIIHPLGYHRELVSCQVHTEQW